MTLEEKSVFPIFLRMVQPTPGPYLQFSGSGEPGGQYILPA